MGTGSSPFDRVQANAAGPLVASAPGSIMLTGEHAVLQGQKALAGAVQQRVSIRLEPRSDQRVRFFSALGTCDMQLDRMVTDAPFSFVGVAAREAAGGAATRGYDLTIDAAMSPHVGLGSSAAITVATYAAVHAYVYGQGLARESLWKACLSIIRAIQGRGSGTDAAASIYGGIICYSQGTGVEERFVDDLPAVHLFYVGYKTPTAVVIDFVEQRRGADPVLYAALDEGMGRCTAWAVDAIRRHDMVLLARALHLGQDTLVAYGVCDQPLQDMLDQILQYDTVHAAKISGSGLGDCVLVLGDVPAGLAYQQIPITWDVEGVKVERV